MTILASRGVFSLIILLLPNFAEIRSSLYSSIATSDKLVENIVKEETNQNPHLNTALRAEILFFTTQVRFVNSFLILTKSFIHFLAGYPFCMLVC